MRQWPENQIHYVYIFWKSREKCLLERNVAPYIFDQKTREKSKLRRNVGGRNVVGEKCHQGEMSFSHWKYPVLPFFESSSIDIGIMVQKKPSHLQIIRFTGNYQKSATSDRRHSYTYYESGYLAIGSTYSLSSDTVLMPASFKFKRSSTSLRFPDFTAFINWSW